MPWVPIAKAVYNGNMFLKGTSSSTCKNQSGKADFGVSKYSNWGLLGETTSTPASQEAWVWLWDELQGNLIRRVIPNFSSSWVPSPEGTKAIIKALADPSVSSSRGQLWAMPLHSLPLVCLSLSLFPCNRHAPFTRKSALFPNEVHFSFCRIVN